jgi:GTP pyrophosphokinase
MLPSAPEQYMLSIYVVAHGTYGSIATSNVISPYVSKGSGIVVHHRNCKNAKIFQQERLIDLSWASNIDRKYPVSIKIYAMTNINLLVEIMNTISLSNMNLLAVNAVNNNNLETVVKLKVLAKDLSELEKMIYNMKKIKYVYNIERDNL